MFKFAKKNAEIEEQTLEEVTDEQLSQVTGGAGASSATTSSADTKGDSNGKTYTGGNAGNTISLGNTGGTYVGLDFGLGTSGNPTGVQGNSGLTIG